MKKFLVNFIIVMSLLFLFTGCVEHHYYHHYHHHTREWYDRHHQPPPAGINFDIDVR